MLIRYYATADRSSCLAVFDSNMPTYFDKSERAEFADFLSAPDAEYFVAESKGTVVACGGYVCGSDVTEATLCWGMVHSAQHRASIGSTLLAWRLERLFSVAHVQVVKIETSQHTASFYSKFGFLTQHIHADGFGVGIDRVEMSLSRANWQRHQV
jgi:predicted GNAT family N-acyltransferase